MNSDRRNKGNKPHLFKEDGLWKCSLNGWTASALTMRGAYERRMARW